MQGKEALISREEAAKISNPVPATAKSIENGKRFFQIYCAVCHGTDGKGMGPVASKFVPPPDITQAFFRARTDGFLYETIRRGGPLMPGQGEALSSKERWDIVNYLRSLQEGGR
jgi:mono/diheme cytochrome c family protein